MDGIDLPKVTGWFEANVDGVKPPLEAELIAGGRSNLTFKMTDAADASYVLRRPPTSHVLPTAHDMGREHRIISALADTDVPVAPALGFCDDPDVNGAPFYVMGFVDGTIVRDAGRAAKQTLEWRQTVGHSLMETLAAIHRVNPDDVGLGDLGRKDGYMARQLKRWYSQFDQSKMREVPTIDEMHDFLSARIPEQQASTIVHGDYRLDNCMLGDDGRVAAVLDWELCTLGDPLADVGLLSVYWSDPNDAGGSGIGAGATALDGFPRRAELREIYAKGSDLDLSHLDYYVAFGYWKLACIMDGVYTRYAKGAMGNSSGAGGAAVEGMGQSVIRLAEQSRHAAAALS